MKIQAWVCASIVAAFIGANPQCLAQSPSDLKDQLVEMGTADQAVREKLSPLIASGNFESDEFKAVVREMASVDSGNLTKLREIIAHYGWPDVDVVGSEASNFAFLVLQHGPLEVQKELLPTFREAALSKKARRDHLAMLEDRILIGDGKKQRYGTQITAGPDGRPRVSPVEDPEDLHERRKSVGLPSMDDYLEQMEARIGRTIDKSALDVQSEP
jgi:hypothetical protein